MQSQYLFVHETLNEILLCGNTEIQSYNLKKIVDSLYSKNFGVEKTKLENEFKVK